VRQLSEELCAQRVRAGDYDEPGAVFASFSTSYGRLIVRKLEIANPRFLAAYQPL